MKTLESCELVRGARGEERSKLLAMCALRRGDLGCICALETEPGEARRLAEMGLANGAIVRMIRPGGTCIVGVNDARLSLCRRLQNDVRVRLVE